MLSLSGLGLSFVSLWFCSEAQGRPHREEDSHCSNQDSGVPRPAQTWPGSSSLCQCLLRFLCVSGCCGRGQLALGLAFAENFGSVLVSFCVSWGTQHDYTQPTDHDRLQGLSPACPPQAWDTVAGQSRAVPPHQSFPAPAPQWCTAKAGLARTPPPSRDLSSLRHCWLAVPGARWTEEEPSCWRQDPEDYLPPTWPRGSAGEWEPLLPKIYSAPTVGTSHPCQRMPGVPLLSGRDFRAIGQPNSSCV